ncbi:MAG TPA: GFA family protein [Rhodanobacteraceae bacterium]|nr:GFA family protein [Rhodanobacteraceae bacterium]
MSNQTYEGQCFCGEVHFEATGAPEVMGYCHCDSCRTWAAAPVNGFTLWKPDSVRVTRGAANVGAYGKTPKSLRKWCMKCGGHLYTEHPLWGVVDVYAATIPALKFEPAIHVNYAETVLRLRDGKPKFKDMPKEMGGSGDTLPE